jgi:DNA-directed RNA polymerase specialized sigma24 family protein
MLDPETREAFDAAYKQYAASIKKLVFNKMKSMHIEVDLWGIAEDITNTAFEKTFKSPQIRALVQNEKLGKKSLIVFLRTTAENLTTDYFRSARQRKNFSYDRPRHDNPVDFINEDDIIEQTLAQVYTDGLRTWIYNALIEIHQGNADKAAYILCLLDYRIMDLSWEEIADKVNNSLSKVKTDWRRSKIPLIKKLKDEGIL